MNAYLTQYYPSNSIIHNLDPRVKIIFSLIFLTFIFISKTIFGIFISFLFLLFIIKLSKVPFNIILKSLKPLLFIVIFSFFTNIIFTQTGNTIFKLGYIKITDEGLLYTFKISFRLIILIISSFLLIFTTSTFEFSDGIEFLLAPLKKIRFPSHEIVMMITISLRFIPTITEEFEKIKKAQMSRGVDFDSGNLINKIKSFVPILIPLFISSFKRADELAIAMESRCYQAGIKRTKMKSLKLKKNDFFALFFTFTYCLVIISFRILVEK